MDPGRAPLSPRDGKRRRGSTSLEAMPVMPPGHHQPQPQTTLPSIRQLHPYLSPSSSSAIPPEATSYSYASAPYNTHLTNPGDPSLQMSGHQRFTESEAEDLDHPSPPKKKRRRQALSCTGESLSSLSSYPSHSHLSLHLIFDNSLVSRLYSFVNYLLIFDYAHPPR